MMIKKELMYILKSEIRLHIILSLNDFPKSPKELTCKEFHISHISYNLKDLMEKNYVMCITPHLRKNKKFILTDKSKKLIMELKELIR